MSQLHTMFFPCPIPSTASPRPRTRAKRVAIRLGGKRTRVWWTTNRSIDNCRVGCDLAGWHFRHKAILNTHVLDHAMFFCFEIAPTYVCIGNRWLMKEVIGEGEGKKANA